MTTDMAGTMGDSTKRLLLAFEQQLREINRETLNPMVEELTTEQLAPVIHMVAVARGNYLKTLIDTAKQTSGEMPSDSQIKELQKYRVRYDELVSAAKALETAIQRGYLDVDFSR